jgi:hypothetical protein
MLHPRVSSACGFDPTNIGWKKNQNPSTKRRSKLAILLLDMWVRLNGIQMDMDQSVSKVTNVQFAQLMGG